MEKECSQTRWPSQWLPEIGSAHVLRRSRDAGCACEDCRNSLSWLSVNHPEEHGAGFTWVGYSECRSNRKNAGMSFQTLGGCGGIWSLKNYSRSPVRPNPSLKLSPNGGPRGPGLAVPCTFSPAQARASHRRCQLSSNVRPHKIRLRTFSALREPCTQRPHGGGYKPCLKQNPIHQKGRFILQRHR
jgi:hypothetical protein